VSQPIRSEVAALLKRAPPIATYQPLISLAVADDGSSPNQR